MAEQTVKSIRGNLMLYFEKHCLECGCGVDDECQIGWGIWNAWWIAMHGEPPGGWRAPALKVVPDE